MIKVGAGPSSQRRRKTAIETSIKASITEEPWGLMVESPSALMHSDRRRERFLETAVAVSGKQRVQ
jgi:hypothetical protein